MCVVCCRIIIKKKFYLKNNYKGGMTIAVLNSCLHTLAQVLTFLRNTKELHSNAKHITAFLEYKIKTDVQLWVPNERIITISHLQHGENPASISVFLKVCPSVAKKIPLNITVMEAVEIKLLQLLALEGEKFEIWTSSESKLKVCDLNISKCQILPTLSSSFHDAF